MSEPRFNVRMGNRAEGTRQCVQQGIERARLRRPQRKLIALCVEERLVTKEAAAALEPSIKFWWMDYRENPTVPLPTDKDWMQSLPR